MPLTLEIRPSPVGFVNAKAHVFGEEGGTIGRADTCSWVLDHPTVSSRHAKISWKDGIFYLWDTDSRNGVAINDIEIGPNKPYPVKSGDRIYIEPFEITVSVESVDQRQMPPSSDDFSVDDPFKPAPVWPSRPPRPPAQAGDGIGLNPLDYFEPAKAGKFGGQKERPPGSGDDVPGSQYDEPPQVPDKPPWDPTKAQIPEGWNPLITAAPPAPPSPEIAPIRSRPRPNRSVDERQPTPTVSDGAFPRDTGEPFPPEVIRSPEVPIAAPVEAVPKPTENTSQPTKEIDLAALLAGAGIPAAALTPELANALGAIIRIVVTGLMDVLQSRQAIKHELEIEYTIFRPKGNNPLKFSTDVQDALHNLFVKHNRAFLGPVDAFADAFDDLRDHELAMLAGVRAAFNSMLKEFEPDHLEREFDRQLGKAGLSLLPAKMRYWDLYRERAVEMTKDQETTFARLFGDSFKRAYEEQLREVKARRANPTAGERTGGEES